MTKAVPAAWTVVTAEFDFGPNDYEGMIGMTND